MNAKCSCQNCNGEFEFDVAEFQESARSGDMVFGQEIPCPHCEKDTMLYLEPQPVVIAQSIAVLPPSSLPEPGQSKETFFFQSGSIAVTNARFIIGTKTFAIRGVTSVDVSESKEIISNPKRTAIAIIGLIFGAAMIVLGLILWLGSDDGGIMTLIVLGIVGLFVIGIALALSSQEKTVFAVILRTGGGEITAYKSFDGSLISKIARALNESIISQG